MEVYIVKSKHFPFLKVLKLMVTMVTIVWAIMGRGFTLFIHGGETTCYFSLLGIASAANNSESNKLYDELFADFHSLYLV